MILPADRKIASVLIKWKLWRFARGYLWGQPTLYPCWGTHWLFNRMRKRQTRDGLHHAPGCAANEWAGQQLVVMQCNCGAARMARQKGLNPCS